MCDSVFLVFVNYDNNNDTNIILIMIIIITTSVVKTYPCHTLGHECPSLDLGPDVPESPSPNPTPSRSRVPV